MPPRVLDDAGRELRGRRRDRHPQRRSAWDFSDWMALHRLPLPALEGSVVRAAHALGRSARRRDGCSTKCGSRTSWSTTRSTRSAAVEAFLEQAAADPHVVAIKMTLYRIGRQLAADRSADRSGRSRQAGRRAGRAEGALRRAQQHQVGDAARVGRRPRRLRRREPEDALQAVPGRPPRRRTACAATRTSAPATTTAVDGAGLHRLRPVHRRSRHRRRTCRRFSTT